MISYTRERDEFVVEATKAGIDLPTTRKLLRYATTLQRLAVAQCNGDWPADNGQRKVEFCLKCQSGFVPESFRPIVLVIPEAFEDLGPAPRQPRPIRQQVCPDCYAQDKVEGLLRGTPLKAVFGGDPRGAVLRLVPRATTREEEQSGRVRGIYVPPSVR